MGILRSIWNRIRGKPAALFLAAVIAGCSSAPHIKAQSQHVSIPATQGSGQAGANRDIAALRQMIQKHLARANGLIQKIKDTTNGIQHTNAQGRSALVGELAKTLKEVLPKLKNSRDAVRRGISACEKAGADMTEENKQAEQLEKTILGWEAALASFNK